MAGPLNEWDIRFLDVVQQLLYIEQANEGGSKPEAFGYPVTLGSAANPLTSGVPFQATVALQADSWFLWTYVSAGVTIPTTATFGGPEQITDAANLLIQFTLPGRGGDMAQIPNSYAGMPAALSCGSPIAQASGIPFQFPNPILLPPNANIQVSATKLGTNAGGDNPDMTGAYIMIHGFRIQVWAP